MQNPRFSRPTLLTAALLGGLLLWYQPVRAGLLAVFWFPLRAVKACAAVIVSLPRLPSLTQENASLRAELIQRQLETAHLRETLRHAQQAQAILEAVRIPQGTVADVIGRSILPTEQTVLLDQGERHGLALDSVVIDAAGVIGRVVEVHAAASLAILLTDPDSRVAAVIERSRETGLLVGRGQGQCELIYLDADADVQAGDRVVTAGLGGPFPKGLLLGIVARLVKDERSGSASAWIAPAARLGQLEEVLCLPSKARHDE